MKMKKILSILTIIILLTSGCDNKKKENKKIDEPDTKNQITNDTKIVIDDQDVLKNMNVVNKNNIIAQLGVKVDDVENYFGAVSYAGGIETYFAVKPAKGKEEKLDKSYDLVILNKRTDLEMQKNEDGTYPEDIQKKLNILDNALKTEYNGYKILIISEDTNKALEAIKPNLK